MIKYIAGPMTNRPQFNRPEFVTAAARLRAAGNIPLNPAVLPPCLSQADYMSICMTMLQCAEAINLLDGCKSKHLIY
ncbi:DUF4406 domain-containing protein [Kluyvera ascorbata]|uniref:DUF4406 domain-containing protein n=1 Tax=Kluyvera ascorbata TaxID=51288 RepID=UPI0022E39C6F|nr:DUF4406 domain-containing protein [Kluyvera ascorbata]HDG1679255.1 DUF4406 domain-containing protein [Kluyvera ascorbata]